MLGGQPYVAALDRPEENAKAAMWLMPPCARTVREHEGSEATINAAAINVLRSIMPIPLRSPGPRHSAWLERGFQDAVMTAGPAPGTRAATSAASTNGAIRRSLAVRLAGRRV